MADGKWGECNDAITITQDGLCLNGQHRLRAVIAADRAVWLDIKRGVPEAAFHYIDTGAARSGGDILSIAGETSTKLLAAGLKLIDAWETRGDTTDGLSLTRATPADTIAILKAHPEARECVRFVVGSKAWPQGMIEPRVVVFLYWLFRQIDEQQAADFMNGLRDGGLETNDPVHRLRERLLSVRLAGTTLGQLDKIVLSIKAWNMRRGGVKTDRIVRRQKMTDETKVPLPI